MNNGPSRPAAIDAAGESFDEVVLPHLDAAYRLARWRMRNEHDAEDVVQEASLRALRYFRTFTGGNGRAWFLRIVRNTCSGWRERGFEAQTDPFDERQHDGSRPASDPETLLLQTDDATVIARAMRKVPDRFHQLLVLREFEGLSYRELADVMGIPMGTVMSSLSRARLALRGALNGELKPSGISARTAGRAQKAEAVSNRVDQRRRYVEFVGEASANSARSNSVASSYKASLLTPGHISQAVPPNGAARRSPGVLI